MKRFPVAAAIILTGTLAFTAGCTTKKTVARETAPLINKTNELDDLTAKTTRGIKDLDARTTQGLNDVNSKSAAADQKAQAAQQSADQASQAANTAMTGVNTLSNQVANLDNYHAVVETTVHFGFDKADLTQKAKDALDKLAAEIPNTKGYIVAVDGNTDSVGPSDYNYQLSQRRARAVIQYLAAEHQVPAHKIYVIGLGKDKPVAKNNTREGRAENRRVDVKLMTNVVGAQEAQAPAQAPTTAQQ
ncbi:MAG: OmpA family protein [Terriglobia bacterium]|nr:OmpA family protein [Terriglobia bacterium]